MGFVSRSDPLWTVHRQNLVQGLSPKIVEEYKLIQAVRFSMMLLIAPYSRILQHEITRCMEGLLDGQVTNFEKCIKK